MYINRDFKKIVEIINNKKVFFFDLDGTLYLEDLLFDRVQELINLLRTHNKIIFFLSNNSSISTKDYLKKLKNLGLNAKLEDIIISTHPTIQYLKEKNIKKIFLLGTKSLQTEFTENGFENTDIDPEIVVLGFDKELTYDKLVKASNFLQNDVPYVATHPDKVCPTNTGYIPDVGSMIALLYESTGKKPKIFGKPNKEMLLFKLRELKIPKVAAIIVGDRLYTDIRMGREADITTICVLSGESSRMMIENSEFKPDIILNKATDLIELLS